MVAEVAVAAVILLLVAICVAAFVDRGIWRYLLGFNHVFKDEDLLIYNKLLDNIEAAER